MPGEVPSTCSAAVFTANKNGRSPTRLRVGSSTAGVLGSSDGRSKTAPLGALTKLWFAMIVPSTAAASTRTTNTIVATLAALGGASTGMRPGVGCPGVESGIPFASGEIPPAPSATATPFSVVLPATYVVFVGTASRKVASVASDVPTLRTVIVYRSRSPASSTDGSPSRSAETLSTSKYGAD